jgi:hypothetical protein
VTVSNTVETPVNDILRYGAALPYTGRYYPYGFPVEIAADSREVLEAANESWGLHQPRFSKPPIRIHVMTGEGSRELPPAPAFRAQRHLLTIISDQYNFAVCDRLQAFGYCWVTRATLADPVFFRWHFLDAAVYILLEQTSCTGVHAACVVREGSGVLLIGASGMGKSTLAYACARQGWTFVTDDGSTLLWDRRDRAVAGEPHRFRFREGAAEIFPELRGLTVGRQLDHKPTIEVRTAGLPIRTAPECTVERIVFLDRCPGRSARMAPVGMEEARERLMGDTTLWEPEVQARRIEVLESLLEAPAFELRYSSHEDAVPLLERLVREGNAE